MGWTTAAANAAIVAAYAPEARRLLAVRTRAALREVQEALLRSTLRRNAESSFGRAHGFAAVRSVRDFRAAVPLSTWDDYADAAVRIRRGEAGVLTSERVLLLEPSSGSTAATKLVPYTATLRAEYERGIKPWLHDLYTAHPRLRQGRAYWSITPAGAMPSGPAGGVRVGFDEDAEYLGPLARRVARSVFAVPSEVTRMSDMDAFLDATCTHLLASADLSVVSVWNPTLFTLLLDRMVARAFVVTSPLPWRRRTTAACSSAGVRPCRSTGRWPTT